MMYFTRHGQTQANERGMFNLPNAVLTDFGVKQALEVAKKASYLGITKIVSSPLERAKQTAEIIATDLGIDVHNIKYDPNLAERSVGILEGAPRNDMTTATIPDDTEDAETSQAIFDRAKQLRNDYVIVTEPTLLVGHAGIYRYLVTALRDGDITEVQYVPQFTQGEIVKLTE